MSFPHTQVGVFEMAKNGMVAVENPSQLFLDSSELHACNCFAMFI